VPGVGPVVSGVVGVGVVGVGGQLGEATAVNLVDAEVVQARGRVMAAGWPAWLTAILVSIFALSARFAYSARCHRSCGVLRH
jgi:hypothetical protein